VKPAATLSRLQLKSFPVKSFTYFDQKKKSARHFRRHPRFGIVHQQVPTPHGTVAAATATAAVAASNGAAPELSP